MRISRILTADQQVQIAEGVSGTAYEMWVGWRAVPAVGPVSNNQMVPRSEPVNNAVHDAIMPPACARGPPA